MAASSPYQPVKIVFARQPLELGSVGLFAVILGEVVILINPFTIPVVAGSVLVLKLPPAVSPTPNHVTTIILALARTMSPASQYAMANPIIALILMAVRTVLLFQWTVVAMHLHLRLS